MSPESPDSGSGFSPGSTDTTSPASPPTIPTDPLAVEAPPFDPEAPREAPPPAWDDYDELPPPEPLEWTPDRAAALVRGAGFVLHTMDGVAREPGAEELWRATDQDASDIGAPLARILNRYAPARTLAGVSDEAELALATMAYAKRNLAERGRLLAERRERDEAAVAAEGGPLFTVPPHGQPGFAFPPEPESPGG